MPFKTHKKGTANLIKTAKPITLANVCKVPQNFGNGCKSAPKLSNFCKVSAAKILNFLAKFAKKIWEYIFLVKEMGVQKIQNV
jgi:hypothetical protein